MRAWVVAFATVVAVMGVGFGLGNLHPFGDPRVEPAEGLGTLLRGAKIPAEAKTVLVQKCADCHSDETHWPVYARVAPGSWLIERDIVEARKKLNLSRWDEMPEDAQQVMIAKIIAEAKSGDMPPVQYRVLHWKAKLAAADVAALASMGRGGGGEASVGGLGDAARGKAVFEKRCTGCHAVEADRDGPRMAGVYGRKAGSVAGFNYSAALKASGVTWDDATLERWLSDTDEMLPGNNMEFRVPKAQERKDLVAWLKVTP
jgi:cytochrome c